MFELYEQYLALKVKIESVGPTNPTPDIEFEYQAVFLMLGVI